jgi:hypothetical protein
MAQQKFRVSDKATQGLFLRSAPVVSDSTRITVLPVGHVVTKKADASVTGWWEVSTTVQGASVDGFASSKFLVPDSAFTPIPTVSSISPVHLRTTQEVKRTNLRYPFPLNETGQPTRNSGSQPNVRAGEVTNIIKWLDVENKARYAPNSQHTYCNIYAYDYCYLGGVYLPRVWWTSQALLKLQQGKSVQPAYGETVNEINANSLYIWLQDFGPTFGWNRTFDFTAMQQAANDGQVVIICGQNKVPNRSGHITAVAPETNTQKAARSGATVTSPLQSQAGRSNRKYMVHAWWQMPSIKVHGCWINAT